MKQLPALLLAAGGGYVAWKFLKPKPTQSTFVPMIDGYGTTIEDPNPCPGGFHKVGVGTKSEACVHDDAPKAIDWTTFLNGNVIIKPGDHVLLDGGLPPVLQIQPKTPPVSNADANTMMRDGLIIMGVITAAYLLSRGKK